jgi:hypothetical protein
MALIVTLALVVLLTVAVMAFFSHATANRRIEASRAHRAKADTLARSAVDYGTSVFLSEITSADHSTNNAASGSSLYLPIATADLIPKRSLSASVSNSDTRYLNLVRQSVPSADSNASEHSTASASKDGRRVSPSRWNLPQLLGGSGFESDNQVANWIYLTPTGISATPTPEAIGRFAYHVYDVGGLLNANTAGYPKVLTAAQVSQIKGTPSGANFLRLSTEVTSEDINNLMTFRNATAAANAASWLDNVETFSRAGNLSTMATSPSSGNSFTNNFFVGRQDLLRYARTQNPNLVKILPYLTHFSRTLNAPTPLFASPTVENPNFSDIRFPASGSVSHYDDKGIASPYDVKAGDPLLQRRFSLARLSWLTPEGPAPDISAEAIQATFGLKWNASEERWDYIGSNSTLRSAISTLDQVAAENREPNFFELLKSGILADSVGSSAQKRTMAKSGNQTYDANADLQILKIGANIIDSGDRDNYPTRIAMDFGGLGIEMAGIEDLPYFHSLWMSGLQRYDLTNPASPMLTDADIFWSPLFINPHRASPSLPTSAPALVTASISSGILTRIDDNNGQMLKVMTKSLASLPAIKIPSQASDLQGAQFGFEDFRSGPRAMRNPNDDSRLGKLIPYADASDADVLGFLIFSYGTEYSPPLPLPAPLRKGDPGFPGSHDSQHRIWVDNLMVRLQYKTLGGQMKTYATLSGNDALPLNTGIWGAGSWDAITTPPGFTSRTDKIALSQVAGSRAVLWDPRTSRYGPGLSGYPAISSLPALSGTGDRLVMGAPLDWNGDKTAIPIYTGLWPQGGKSRDAAGNYTNTPDKDGTFRPADGWLGNAANPYRQVTGSSLNITHASRPILLQRPYQSVAELGYVFRDSPWKTLSFFDETSADDTLLELFSLYDQPATIAGSVNLNTPHQSIREALLDQISQNADGSTPLSNVDTIASAYTNFAFTSGTPSTRMPGNVSALAKFMSSPELTTAFSTTLNPLKSRREAIVRALAGPTQTRTWNLLIDVIAQNGRFIGSATGESDFLVEGEQRYWLSIAIDRFTAKIIDRQLESVNE